MTSPVIERGYSLGEFVGAGSVGYVCKSKKENTVLALKEIQESVSSDEAENEGKCMKTLGYHDNVLLLVDRFTASLTESTKAYYLVSEYCLCTITQLQNSGLQLNLPDIKAMFHQMLKGLEFIHSKRIIHRDIKPDNILVSAGGILKIADFGCAIKLDKGHAPLVEYYELVGTGNYMPPEVLLCKDFDERIDIWSLGCVFAEMFIRQPLFNKGADYGDQLNLILHMCTKVKDSYSFNDSVMRYTFYYPSQPKNKLYKILTKEAGIADTSTARLIAQMLKIKPKHRPTARDLLKNQMFNGTVIDIKVAAYVYWKMSQE